MANQHISNELGQSLVEYILLLLVVVSLAAVVFNHPKFKDFFGEDSNFFTAMRKRMEYSYRHANSGSIDDSDYDKKHHTYTQKNGDSRFFAPVEAYPRQ